MAADPEAPGYGRREFARRAGAAGLALGLAGCGASAPRTPAPAPGPGPVRRPGSVAPAVGGTSLADLADVVRGAVITSGSAAYAGARRIYNEAYDGDRPLAVVRPLDEADVRATLRWAARRDVVVRPRGGGHSYAGYSTGDGAVVVDLRELSGVAFDRGTGVASIGPGAQLAAVYARLAVRGVTIPAGSCPAVGLGGHALGGGIGLAGRALGLTADNIVGARMITADGVLHQAGTSAGEDADLLWALRGAGAGNFGVVTRLRMRTHPVSPTSWFSISWPWSAAGEALDAWQRLVPGAPEALTSVFHLSAGGGSVGVSASGQYFGPASRLAGLLAPLTAVGGGRLSSGTDQYLDLMLRWAGCLDISLASCRTEPAGSLPRARFAAKSDYVARALPAAGRQLLISAVERASVDGSLSSAAILLDSYGGAINRIRPAATAFVHRDALFGIQYLTYYPSAGQRSAAGAWLRGAWAPMRGYVSGEAYQNYIDPDLIGWERAYYATNYPRLQQTKAKYDPDRRFDFAQAISAA
ncbi:MAG TPA: FAD-binding oxidoreductase [Solirubrobacteraceae bacterium]|jgi:FAD/FMN-containing dehydrogenase|nr:FAD-binding oxidoreductase [Solirubrobacteraceae bacterium]